jgi:hypothetical protein
MKPTQTDRTCYEIRVVGSLPQQWRDWFDGLVLNTENGETLLYMPEADQAALFGLLKKVRDLGLMLVSVNKKLIQEKKMNEHNQMTTNKKAFLSTLWIFAVLNYLYCDVASLMDSDLLRQYLSGIVGGMEISQGFLLAAGVLMEVSISMVLLSKILPYRANRWANIGAGIFTTVIQTMTLFAGALSMYYLFFSIIEIGCTTFITWYAWNWRNNE